MHAVLRPFLLRRLKTDVDLSIPTKKETIIYCALTPKQEAFYKGVLNKTILEDINQAFATINQPTAVISNVVMSDSLIPVPRSRPTRRAATSIVHLYLV